MNAWISSENAFRMALVAISVVAMLITIFHRRQAASSGEKLSRKAEGYTSAIALRIAGLCLWIATFGYLFFPASFQFPPSLLPIWVRWMGVLTATLCLFLFYWTLSSLGRNLTDTVVTRQAATLVTHGPYRWVRHPYYVATTGRFLPRRAGSIVQRM